MKLVHLRLCFCELRFSPVEFILGLPLLVMQNMHLVCVCVGGCVRGCALMVQTNAINVLDIFGFETFETNSFEQLCINYCNEKLQSHFNEHIFKLEEEEYKREGIDVANADFADNQPCLDLLEKERTGVFDLLDDEIYVPRGSDEGFLNKVLQIKHANLKRPKPKEKDSRVCFNILHFALHP